MAGAASRENGKKGGRPKGKKTLLMEKAREMVAVALDKDLKPILAKAITQAKAGDRFAREWLSNYAWGKPVSIVMTEDEDGERKPIVGMKITME